MSSFLGFKSQKMKILYLKKGGLFFYFFWKKRKVRIIALNAEKIDWKIVQIVSSQKDLIINLLMLNTPPTVCPFPKPPTKG